MQIGQVPKAYLFLYETVDLKKDPLSEVNSKDTRAIVFHFSKIEFPLNVTVSTRNVHTLHWHGFSYFVSIFRATQTFKEIYELCSDSKAMALSVHNFRRQFFSVLKAGKRFGLNYSKLLKDSEYS